MSEVVIRCPYCVSGDEFRPMFRHHGKKIFICVGCGHRTLPGAIYSACQCPKCRSMNRAATRCRESQELRPHVSPDARPPALAHPE
jgi:Zn ribbon nucleic-acid-binding protein